MRIARTAIHRIAQDIPTRRGGFTLLEVVISLSVLSVLMVGLVSAIAIATRSIDQGTGPAAVETTSREAVRQVTADIRFATSFSERAPTAVTFTVPDRDRDGLPEVIRYAWSGAAGDPLTRRYNDGTEVAIADDVQILDFEYLYRTMPGELAQGGGAGGGSTVLLVMQNAAMPSDQALARRAMIESWGYSVAPISAGDSYVTFQDALAGADVAYVCEEISVLELGKKLMEAPIGVVCEKVQMHEVFGFGGNYGVPADVQTTDIVDNTHEITDAFAVGSVTICTINQPLAYFASQYAPDLETLATVYSSFGEDEASLSVLEAGATAYGGRTAAGRRVQLPWAAAAFDINTLTGDGALIMERAIRWAESGSGGAGPAVSIFGYDTPFGTPVSSVRNTQIATQVVLGESGTLTSITAYVDCAGSRTLRYGLYTDAGGNPGDLVVETARVTNGSSDPQWFTAPVTPTALDAGTYWLALAFDYTWQRYFHDPGGQTRYKDHDAEANGFLPTWGPSTESFAIKVAIYGTYTPD